MNDTSKCKQNWKTCGHCLLGIDSCGYAYGSCDKVGFFSRLIGDDICMNALISEEEETVSKDVKNDDIKNAISCWKERKEYEITARKVYEAVEEVEEIMNNDKPKEDQIKQIKPIIDYIKFLSNKLQGEK